MLSTFGTPIAFEAVMNTILVHESYHLTVERFKLQFSETPILHKYKFVAHGLFFSPAYSSESRRQLIVTHQYSFPIQGLPFHSHILSTHTYLLVHSLVHYPLPSLTHTFYLHFSSNMARAQGNTSRATAGRRAALPAAVRATQGRPRPYACSLGCTDKTFINASDLQGHFNSKHPNSNKVVEYICVCKSTFSDHSNLMRHRSNCSKCPEYDSEKTWQFNCPHCQGTERGSTNKRGDNLKTRHNVSCPLRPAGSPASADRSERNQSLSDLNDKQMRFWGQQDEARATTTSDLEMASSSEVQTSPIFTSDPAPDMGRDESFGDYQPADTTIDPELQALQNQWASEQSEKELMKLFFNLDDY